MASTHYRPIVHREAQYTSAKSAAQRTVPTCCGTTAIAFNLVKMSSVSGFTLWLTGLPCAGKSTIAQGLAGALLERGRRVEVLDGDAIRQNLSYGLGFTREDRDRNVLRLAFVANLLARNGVIVIVAAVSPYRAARAEARQLLRGFVEIHVNCPAHECERRDVKGMYRKARAGTLPGFTGIDDPYEAPTDAEIVLRTDLETAEESIARTFEGLQLLGYGANTGLEESTYIPVARRVRASG